jgi:hypothetical protein
MGRGDDVGVNPTSKRRRQRHWRRRLTQRLHPQWRLLHIAAVDQMTARAGVEDQDVRMEDGEEEGGKGGSLLSSLEAEMEAVATNDDKVDSLDAADGWGRQILG